MGKIQFNKSSIIKLIILISFIVIMFSLLSFTFVTIIIKKKDNAYLQERTKQQLLDLNEKENNPNYITWEEYESILVDKLINIQSTNILNEYNQINSKVLESIEDFNKS